MVTQPGQDFHGEHAQQVEVEVPPINIGHVSHISYSLE